MCADKTGTFPSAQSFLWTVLFLKPLPLPLPALLYRTPGLFQGYFPAPSNAEVSTGVLVAKTVWGQSTKPKDLPQPWPDGHVMMTNSTFKASLLGGQTELHLETGRKPGQRGETRSRRLRITSPHPSGTSSYRLCRRTGTFFL
uniref:Uncharacterized protein n=1 Tax=Myotis myotis TaxID=51298 RepID=A0A7J7TJH3_MYOMY|nr:hypothetical protein mMyoMyo1_009044 [Myotis myotis]